MATDVETLVVNLEARVNQFEKGLERANATATRTYRELTAGSSRATRAMEADFTRSANQVERAMASISTRVGDFSRAFRGNLVGAFSVGFAGGAAAGLLTQLPRLFGDVTKSIVELRGEAAKAGVSFEAFQAIKYAADQSGVSVDGLTDGLKELQLRADEFVVTGKGPAAEAFARLGMGAKELKDGLRDPIRLLDDIIKRLGTFDRAAQIRILDEVFGGTGGEQFQKFLVDGARGLRELTNEAERIGAVLDEDVGRRAAEIDAQFDRISRTIGTSVKGAVVSVSGELAKWVELLSTVETRSAQSIQTEIANREKAIAEAQGSVLGPVSGTYVENQQAEIAKLRAELARRAIEGGPTPVPDRETWLNRDSATPGAGDKLASVKDDLEAAVRQMMADAAAAGHELTVTSGLRSTDRQRELWQEALAKYGSPAVARKHVAPPGSSMHEKGSAVDMTFGSMAARSWVQENMGAYGLAAPVPSEQPNGTRHAHLELAGARGGAKPRDEAAIAAERQAEAYQKVVDALRFEGQQLGRNTLAQEVAEAQRRAGVEAASAEGKAIADLVGQNYELQRAREAAADVQERAAEAAAELNGVARDTVGGFLHDLKDGVPAVEALSNALERLSDRLLDMALDSIFDDLLKGGGGASGGTSFFDAIGSGLMTLFGGGAGAGAPLQLAGGGPVRGPGTSTSDSIPARLSDGEYVVREAAARPNRGLLDAINYGQAAPAARGGGGQSAGTTVIIEDKRGRGAPKVEQKRSRGPSGEEMVRVLIRDEIVKSNAPGGLNDRNLAARGIRRPYIER